MTFIQKLSPVLLALPVVVHAHGHVRAQPAISEASSLSRRANDAFAALNEQVTPATAPIKNDISPSNQAQTQTTIAISTTDHRTARSKSPTKVQLTPHGGPVPAATPPKQVHPPEPRKASSTAVATRKVRVIPKVAHPPSETSLDQRPYSVSIGSPSNGRLENGVTLNSDESISVRSGRNFGTNRLVSTITDAVTHVRHSHPTTHRLAIGDLSYKNGGPMRGHRSHQSGRDADLSYYLKSDQHSPRLVTATPSSLDAARTWALLTALKDTANVEMIFIDYRLQAVLYRYAVSVGVAGETIKAMLAYPRGRKWKGALVRHWPGHADHLHVRVKR